jgi:hypothetical protein
VIATGIAIAAVLGMETLVVIAGEIIAPTVCNLLRRPGPSVARTHVPPAVVGPILMARTAITPTVADVPGIGRTIGRDIQNLTRKNVVGVWKAIDLSQEHRMFIIHPANAVQGFAPPYAVMLTSTVSVAAPGRRRC